MGWPEIKMKDPCANCGKTYGVHAAWDNRCPPRRGGKWLGATNFKRQRVTKEMRASKKAATPARRLRGVDSGKAR